MEPIIFGQYDQNTRRDLVHFSENYIQHRECIKNSLIEGQPLRITLLRLTEETVARVSTHDYTIKKIFPNGFEATYVDTTYDPPLLKKVIRWDNPLAEIPVLPDWTGKPITLGNNITEYAEFINQVKSEMRNDVGKIMVLTYKNDDGSISIIESLVTEVNKSNFLGNDITEKKVVGGKTVAVKNNSGVKNHRFISETGFLYSLQIKEGVYTPIYDDEEVFGENEFK